MPPTSQFQAESAKKRPFFLGTACSSLPTIDAQQMKARLQIRWLAVSDMGQQGDLGCTAQPTGAEAERDTIQGRGQSASGLGDSAGVTYKVCKAP